MNYFTSCIYGDYEKYMKIKSDLNLRDGDDLYIIGDIIDGNDEDPQANIEIMNDLIESENIHLILGDHEYARIMWYASMGNEESAKAYIDFSNAFDVSGAPFNEYVKSSFCKDDYDIFFGAYLASCELSAVVPVGKRYFYLVHGTPVLYSRSYETQWQMRVVTGQPDFSRDFYHSIRTDEMALPYLRDSTNPMTRDNTVTIVGQMSAMEAAMVCNVPEQDEGVFYKNKTLAIGRHFTNEPITVIGVDAAGFFLYGRY